MSISENSATFQASYTKRFFFFFLFLFYDLNRFYWFLLLIAFSEAGHPRQFGWLG